MYLWLSVHLSSQLLPECSDSKNLKHLLRELFEVKKGKKKEKEHRKKIMFELKNSHRLNIGPWRKNTGLGYGYTQK